MPLRSQKRPPLRRNEPARFSLSKDHRSRQCPGHLPLRPLSPLFDEEIIRLSFTMPPTRKLAAGQEKVIMKQAFAGRLPDAILHRPKSGMRVPVHHWMQKEMKRHAREVLNPRRLKKEVLRGI
ncbi:asparagine synthase-related protein [Verrucomicrobiaceae bacterium 227]